MRFKITSILAAVIGFCLIFSVGLAMAEDVKVGPVVVQSIGEYTDKNGDRYMRAIVSETRSLNGVTYQAGVPVMTFGDSKNQLAGISAGDQISFIADKRLYNGSNSYTLRAVIK